MPIASHIPAELSMAPSIEHLTCCYSSAPITCACRALYTAAHNLSRTHTPVPDPMHSALLNFVACTAVASCDASVCCDQCACLTSSTHCSIAHTCRTLYSSFYSYSCFCCRSHAYSTVRTCRAHYSSQHFASHCRSSAQSIAHSHACFRRCAPIGASFYGGLSQNPMFSHTAAIASTWHLALLHLASLTLCAPLHQLLALLKLKSACSCNSHCLTTQPHQAHLFNVPSAFEHSS